MTVGIGLMGYPASGKTTATEYLVEEYGAEQFSLGDVVRKLVGEIEEASSEEVLSDELQQKAEEQGESVVLPDNPDGEDISDWVTRILRVDSTYIIREAVPMLEQVDADLVVIDGVRQIEDVKRLRDFFEPFELVYLDAPFEERVSRVSDRGREGEGENPRENLRKRDQNEDEWGVIELIENETYDHKLDASGSVEELQTQLDEVLLTVDSELAWER